MVRSRASSIVMIFIDEVGQKGIKSITAMWVPITPFMGPLHPTSFSYLLLLLPILLTLGGFTSIFMTHLLGLFADFLIHQVFLFLFLSGPVICIIDPDLCHD